MNNPYIVNIMFSIIMVMLAGVVYVQDPGRIQNRVFLIIGVCAALSIVCIFMTYSFKDAPEITTLLNRLSVVFVLLLVATHLYFSMIFPMSRIRRPLVTLTAICGPVLLLALPILGTDLFVKTMVIQGRSPGVVMLRDLGIFYKGVYAPLMVGYILLSCGMFAWQYRMATSGIAGKQVIYTAMAMAGGGFVITLSCIVLPLAGISRYYQVGPLFVAPFYVTVMAINIISLRAMDIDQFLSRLFLWGLSILVMGLLISFAVGEIWAHSHHYHLAGATLLLGACFMAGFIYMILIQPRISRWLQRKSHAYARIVDRFHNKILQLKTVDHLADLICKTIDTFLKPKHISIFLRRAGSPRFFLKQGHHYDGPDLIDVYLDKLREIPLFDKVIEKEQVAQNKQYSAYRDTGMNYFAKFGCVLIMPIIYKGELIGVINLGPRFQGFYKRVEIVFLEKLMTGINVAFSNAMLLDRIETINTSLTRFVPLQGLQLMGHEQITEVKLGDSVQREMTIVFCDVKGFAALSEQMTPRENFQFLNKLLKGISPVIRMHNGFIDKYIGDAIMALFPGSPQDGVNAAMGMLKVLNRHNHDARRNGSFPVQMGIGIHTGMLMLGTIGEQERMDSTVISDAVNLAQRIERMTRLFGVSLIISEAVAAVVGKDEGQAIRYLGQVKVKGKKNSVSLYERFDVDSEPVKQLKLETRLLFEKGVGHYFHNERSLALDCFESVLATGLDDPVSRAYIKGNQRFCVEIK